MKSVPLLLLTLLLTTTPVMAQTVDDTGWPVIERCVGEPTAPPEDWTFAGTILMTGYAGIHGVNADWDTPRVAVFLRNKDWQNENMDLPGGALSPDGNWYASPYGSREVTDTWNMITQVSQIRIHELFANKVIVRDWPGSTYYGGTNGQIRWLDDQTLVHDTFTQGTFVLNPFNGEMEAWASLDNLLDSYFGGLDAFFSPDTSRMVYGTGEFDNRWFLVNISDESIVQANLPLPFDNKAIIWASDSEHFFAEVENETSHAIVRFDVNGLPGDEIYSLPDDDRVGSTSFRLSNDDAYLAFVVIEDRPSVFNMVGRLYIAELSEQRVIDTCLDTPRSLIWSPTGHQIALQSSNYGQGMIDVLIFDLAQWQVYPIARQINPDNYPDEIIGWRVD